MSKQTITLGNNRSETVAPCYSVRIEIPCPMRLQK